MIRIGLTGSIGMGKSAVSAMFAQLGVPLFDADAEVHRLQGPGGALVAAIEARFSGSTGPQGVDRQKLGPMVFGKPDELRALEKIIHPAVYKARQAFLSRNRSRPLVLLDIPLLFEVMRKQRRRSHPQADLVVVVSAPPWLQRKRVMARPGMSRAKFKQIKGLQVADHIKRRRADHVIETARPKNVTRAHVKQLVACLLKKKGRY
jgi:dephospho-CoA kinase